MFKKYRRAFTLIEMLVVIAIIGILATMITVNVSKSRAKGRDAKRMADLNTIANALELYYDDHGEYPTTGGGDNIELLSGILGSYLPTIPKDPLYNQPVKTECNRNGWPWFIYYYWAGDPSIDSPSAGKAFTIVTFIENGGMANEGFKWGWADGAYGRECYYAVLLK